MRACVRACVHVFVRPCVRASVRASVRPCVCACVRESVSPCARPCSVRVSVRVRCVLFLFVSKFLCLVSVSVWPGTQGISCILCRCSWPSWCLLRRSGTFWGILGSSGLLGAFWDLLAPSWASWGLPQPPADPSPLHMTQDCLSRVSWEFIFLRRQGGWQVP